MIGERRTSIIRNPNVAFEFRICKFKFRTSNVNMNFSRFFFFVFALFLAASTVSAAPKWKIFKKLERVGQNVRDGIIKAGPAVSVVGQAATIYKGK